MKNTRIKIVILSIAALVPIVSIHGVNPAFAGDVCHIHSGCKTGVRYGQNESLGKGWFCDDEQAISKQSKFDECLVSNCPTDTSNIKYGPVWGGNEHALPRVTGQAWQCYDNAFIHKGCTKGAIYKKAGTPGSAWYCNDGQKVDKSTQIDASFISPGCKEGVKFDSGISAWRCND